MHNAIEEERLYPRPQPPTPDGAERGTGTMVAGVKSAAVDRLRDRMENR